MNRPATSGSSWSNCKCDLHDLNFDVTDPLTTHDHHLRYQSQEIYARTVKRPEDAIIEDCPRHRSDSDYTLSEVLNGQISSSLGPHKVPHSLHRNHHQYPKTTVYIIQVNVMREKQILLLTISASLVSHRPSGCRRETLRMFADCICFCTLLHQHHTPLRCKTL